MAQGGTSSGSDGDLSLSDLDCSLQMTRTATKRAPVTAVLTGRPSMLRPEMKSPTAVAAALNKQRSANKTTAKEAAPPRPARNNTATTGGSRIDVPASSRPMLCEQKSPITVPNVLEMNMQ
jgi:hypothetical protein